MTDRNLDAHIEQLQRAGDALASLSNSKPEQRIDADLLHLVDVILKRVDIAFKHANLLLVPDALFTSMQNHLHTLGDQLIAAASSGDPGNIEQQANKLRTDLLAFPIDVSDVDASIAQQSALKANELVKEIGRYVSATEDGAHTVLKEIESKIKELGEKAVSGIDKNKKEHDALIASIKTSETNQATRVDESIARLEKQGSESESERNKDWQVQTKDFNDQMSKIVSESQDSIASALEGYENDANSLLMQISIKDEKSSEILGLITNRGVLGRFAATAKREAFWARIFNIATVILLFLIVIGAWYTAVALGADKVEWQTVFVRALLTITLALPAFFAQKVAADHRKYEKRNNTTAMELASIDVFIETLPKEDQDKLKAELAKSIFGRVDNDSSGQTVLPAIDSLQKLLHKTLDIINKTTG